jgi:hypothetical protein
MITLDVVRAKGRDMGVAPLLDETLESGYA